MHSVDELITWLESWTYSNKKKPLNTAHIVVTTIDNPGWGVTIDLANRLYNKELPLADVTNSENDWYYCTINDNKFEGDGGLFNLEDIFRIFKQLINDKSKYCISNIQKIKINDDLTWLLKWFANQCDGDWEHGNGIKIETTDNPGWYLNISLCETELEKKDFQIIDVSRTEKDWIYCTIKDTLFQGFGGPFNLSEIIAVFRNWVEL
ncbi:MAG: Imm53 family immunity protein [Chlamydiales bacterium]